MYGAYGTQGWGRSCARYTSAARCTAHGAAGCVLLCERCTGKLDHAPCVAHKPDDPTHAADGVPLLLNHTSLTSTGLILAVRWAGRSGSVL